ncbi:helix-turn-helix domain-containing protein [Aureimonas ureilytica]|nr:helix-turn-helix transcriptional regulator [Aureimonas ureilytica]
MQDTSRKAAEGFHSAPDVETGASALESAAETRRPFEERNRMALGDNVRRLRTTDGETIETLARATNLPVQMLKAVEDGRRDIPPKALLRLAQHFRVKPDDLLG